MQKKKVLLMARGNSHIRYFRQIAERISLDVAVIQVTNLWPGPRYFKYWQQLKDLKLDEHLLAHFEKKRRKLPWLDGSALWKPYQALSRLNLKLQIAKYCGLIKAHNPDAVGVWNGQKLPSSSIKLAAVLMGKEVVHFENGLMPNTTVCDWQGVNCHNALPSKPDFYYPFAALGKSLPSELTQRKPVKVKAQSLADDKLPDKFLFVPFQMETDSQIISNSPWIRTMEQLWHALAKALSQCDDPNLQVVIKEHPLEKNTFEHLHGKHPKIHFANQSSTQHLIEQACAVATINSTVGVESLLLGKRLLVLGNACYGLDGLCQRIENEQQLTQALTDLEQFSCDETLRQGFLKFLYFYYSIPQAWNTADTEHFSALENRLLKQDELFVKLKSAKQT